MGFYGKEYFLNEDFNHINFLKNFRDKKSFSNNVLSLIYKDKHGYKHTVKLQGIAKEYAEELTEILKKYIDKLYKNKEFLDILNEMKNSKFRSSYVVEKDKPTVTMQIVKFKNTFVDIFTDSYWMSQDAYYYKSEKSGKMTADFIDEIVEEIKNDKKFIEISKQRKVVASAGDDCACIYISMYVSNEELVEEN